MQSLSQSGKDISVNLLVTIITSRLRTVTYNCKARRMIRMCYCGSIIHIRVTLDAPLPGMKQMVLPTGLEPASYRLEVDSLSFRLQKHKLAALTGP